MQLQSPLREQFPITQQFGLNPANYARFNLRGHNGIDYGTPIGTPIKAVAAGTVLEVFDDPPGYGRYVKLGHEWGESLYAHLERQMVTVGATVAAGQQIGMSGNTGNSTGPHLHFGLRIKPYFRDDGWAGYVDPYPYLHKQPTGAIIGPHIIGGVHRHLALLEQWQPRLILVLDPNPQEMAALRSTCPHTVIVGRIYRPDSEIHDRIMADPKAAAKWAHDITMERMTHHVDYWQFANEVLQDWSGLPLLSQFCIERMRLAEDQGYHCAIMGFSVGNPDMPEHDRMALWRQVYPALEMAEAGGHVIAIHQYGKPTLWQPDPEWYIHRLELQVLPRLPYRKLKFVVTEYGIDGLIHSTDGIARGFRNYTDEIGYTKQLLQIGPYLERFRGQVLGYAVFTLGTGGDEKWNSYDIADGVSGGLSTAPKQAQEPVKQPDRPVDPPPVEQEKPVNTTINQAAAYGVTVVPTAATDLAWRCVEVRHLTPDENRGRHNVFVDVVDESGQRVRDPSLRIAWTWVGRREDEPAPPKPLDKPDNEAAGNVEMYSGQIMTVWIDGQGLLSDRVAGMHTKHADELGPNGETWNSVGHHSFYVKFQRKAGGVVAPPVDPPDLPPVEQPDPCPEPPTLESLWRAVQGLEARVRTLEQK